jgi:hypothetical protein
VSADIGYKQFAEESIHPGRVFFTDLNGMIYNLTNDTLNENLSDTILANLDAKFMNRSKAAIQVKIPMASANQSIYVNGTLASLDVRDLNIMTENVAFVRLNGGKIKSMEYHFTMDKNNSLGNMILVYDDLDISLINKDAGRSTGIKIKVMNFIAKKFIIQSSNPSPGKPVRQGIISYPRNPEKFIINYGWKSIFSGIKSTIGLQESGSIKK